MIQLGKSPKPSYFNLKGFRQTGYLPQLLLQPRDKRFLQSTYEPEGNVKLGLGYPPDFPVFGNSGEQIAHPLFNGWRKGIRHKKPKGDRQNLILRR